MCLSKEQKDKLKACVKELTRQEKLVILMYYSEEMTSEEIGAILDLSASRVNEIHFSAIRQLRAAYWSE